MVTKDIDRIANLDRLASQAITILTEQVTANGRQIESLASLQSQLRDEVHQLDLKIAALATADLKLNIADHEMRIRNLQDWKANMTGRQAALAAIIAAIVSIVIPIASRLIH